MRPVAELAHFADATAPASEPATGRAGAWSPFHDETSAFSLAPTDVSEALEVKGLWLAIATDAPISGGEPPELDQSRLLGMQSQAKLLKTLPQVLQELLGFVPVLEAQDESSAYRTTITSPIAIRVRHC
jgi:hypothetical protein